MRSDAGKQELCRRGPSASWRGDIEMNVMEMTWGW